VGKRRANGEGSIYQRKDGRWAASISLGGMKRKHFLGKTRADVAGKLAVALKTHNEGLPVRFERQTFSAYITRWLNETMKGAVAPRTWTRYEQLMRVHAIPAIGKLPLEKVTPQHVQRLYADVSAKGAKPGTIVQVHAVLHKAFKQAVLWNLASRNPVEAVTRPKQRHEEMNVLTPDQAVTLIEAARRDRLEALFVLAVTTGMRQGELLGLRWSAVESEKGTVQIQVALQRTKDGYELVPPKTRGSRRLVKLTQMAREALERHRINQTAERLLAGDHWKNELDLVFTNLAGGPLDGTHLLRHCFRPLLKKGSLPEVRFHDLRHTAATLLLTQGIHPKVVSEMLGHSTTGITLDLYSHVMPSMQEQAAAALDSLFGRK
jgi:integrase